MIFNLKVCFLLFIIYSFLGWVMECVLGILQKHKFVNRGFLIGPYCPIYGVGVVSVSLLLTRFSNNIILLFLLSTFICGSLEYFTSYIMEKIFNARWWDYTQKKFNINGRVCLETLIPFGVISVLVICYLNPWILSIIAKIPQNMLDVFSITFVILYIIDSAVSLNIILGFKNLSKKEKDNTEEISKKVRETAEAAIEKLNFEKQKLIRKMNVSRYTLAKNIKYTRKKYTNKIKNQPMTIIGTLKLNTFKEQIQNIDEKIRNIAKDVSDKVASIKENQFKLSKDIKEKFVKQSKLNKRLISAFPNVQQKDYTRKKKIKKINYKKNDEKGEI